MNIRQLFGTLALPLTLGLVADGWWQARAGEVSTPLDYKVLAPIRHGNLTVFPVVAATSHDTGAFLTLDEGIKSGEVEVTEYGNARGMIRRRPRGGVIQPDTYVHDGAQVNKLVLLNHSKRPLLLLAGEIVTGGKQDRVIAKDRIVPAESDPIDLDVFCVEPGRWVAGVGGGKFAQGSVHGAIVAPSVRGKAMADKNQAEVWAEVAKAQHEMADQLMVEAPAASRAVTETSSYARVMENDEVKKKVDSVAGLVEQQYSSTIQQLRDKKAVGVVVAVNGEIVWADIFASTSLLEKYWPKLVRSYATEAVVTRAKGAQVSESAAQEFLEHLHGRHETVDSEPGVYRHTEVTGDGFKAFELTSLLPKTGFALHIAKMTE